MTTDYTGTLNALCTEMAVAFNNVTERVNWRARVGGSRRYPEVLFTNRTSMVVVSYSPSRKEFTVAFQRVTAAWGDYLAGAYRSLVVITFSLKAAGFDFSTALADETCLRLEFNPKTKRVTIHLAKHGDDWQTPDTETLKPTENN